MADAITPLQLNLLRLVAQHPGLQGAKLLALKGVQAEDLAYLTRHDLIREGEVGCYRIAHLGQMVLKRSNRG
jgi:hypothetical protein